MDLVDLPELSKGFVVIPSIAVMGKTPVRVRDQRYEPIKLNGRTLLPESIAHVLSEKFEILHYLDITGIRSQKVEWNTFQKVMEEGEEVWADVGVTFSDTIIDTLMSGASYGIVTTKMIQSIEEIASAYELTENIILQIDHDNGILSKDPNISEMDVKGLINEMSSFGMDTYILYDIGQRKSGESRNVIMEALEALPSRGRLFVGASSLQDLAGYDEMGLDGAIISASKIMRGYD
jgi:phosphoribosylformimino-5-aminoimidazole carboxamide ribonucleotide (ProFAR) isomerase